MTSLHRSAIAGLVALVSTTAMAGGATDVFDAVSKSVVTVEMRDELGMPSATASGVVLGKGEVVTNCHVVTEGESISVRDASAAYRATWTLRDPKHDLCLLRAEGLNAPAASLGSTKDLKLGDPVYAVGNPLGLGLSITEGGLAATPRLEDGLFRLVTTAQVSPGSSGGGLFDGRGRLLGITTAIYGTGQGFSLALAVEGLEALRKGGQAVTLPSIPPPETEWQPELDAARTKQAWAEVESIARRYLELYPDSDFARIRLGQALLRTGRRALARPLFEEALKLNPDSLEALGFLAFCYTEEGDHVTAETKARQLVSRWPGNAYAHVVLGDALQFQKKWAEASAHYQRAVELYPSGDDYWATLGELQARQDQFEAALRSTQIALRLNPENKTAKTNLPMVLAKLGRWQEARTRMDEGGSSDTGANAETWVRVGNAALAAQRLTDAELAYRKAIALDPKSEKGRAGLGSVLIIARRFPEAERFLSDSLVLFPQDAALLMLMGQAQAARGDFVEAEKSLMLSVQKEPNDSNAWRQLYGVRQQRRDYSGMAMAMEEVLRRDSNDAKQSATRATDLINLSRALIPLNEFDRAEKALQEALRLQPNSAVGYMVMASLKGRRGDAAGGLEYAEKALAIDPGLVPALSSKGYGLFRLNRLQEAAQTLEIAVRLAPDDSNALINLGQVYMAQAQLGRAIPVLEHAVKLAPNAEDAWSYLMDCLVRAGQLPRAKSEVDKWLQQRPNGARALYWSTAVSLMTGDRNGAVATYRRLQMVDVSLAAEVKRRSRAPGVPSAISLPD